MCGSNSSDKQWLEWAPAATRAARAKLKRFGIPSLWGRCFQGVWMWRGHLARAGDDNLAAADLRWRCPLWWRTPEQIGPGVRKIASLPSVVPLGQRPHRTGKPGTNTEEPSSQRPHESGGRAKGSGIVAVATFRVPAFPLSPFFPLCALGAAGSLGGSSPPTALDTLCSVPPPPGLHERSFSCPDAGCGRDRSA